MTAFFLLLLTLAGPADSRIPVEAIQAWRSIGPDGATVLDFAAGPDRTGTIYALTPGRLFRSSDSGATWGDDVAVPVSGTARLVIASGQVPALYAFSDYGGFPRSLDGGHTWVSANLDGQGVTDLAVDPTNSKRILAAAFTGLWLSEDGSATWRNVLIPGGRAVWFDRFDPRTAFAGGSLMYKSVDGGKTWQPLPGPDDVIRFAQDPRVAGVLYAETEFHGIFKTVDGGDSWIAIGQPIGLLLGLAVDGEGTVYGVTDSGLGIRHDGGSSWEAVSSIPAQATAVLADASVPSQVYVAARHTVYRTNDGGVSFVASNHGLINPGFTSLALDPDNPRRIFLGAGGFPYVARGLIERSSDGGSSWTMSAQDVYASGFALDPVESERVYAAGLGVYRSEDGGAKWIASSDGLSFVVPALLLDPFNPAILYVGSCCGPGGSAGGVYKSTHRGAFWTQKIQGFPKPSEPADLEVDALAADPVTPGVIYAGTRYGVLKSSDRGETWSATGLSSDVRVLAVDPGSPLTVYVGYARSDDGGLTWRDLPAPAGTPIVSLVIDPSGSGVLYAATESGVFRSTDRGETWQSLNQGLRDLCVGSLAIDATGRFLAAATCSKGVYVRQFRPTPQVLQRSAAVSLHKR